MSDLQRVGEVRGTSGAPVPFTAGILGASRVQLAHAEYFDAVTAGRVFSLNSTALTIAAAHSTAGALATAKFIVGVWNPVSSGKWLSVLETVVTTTSGTPAGPYFYDAWWVSTITSAATGTIYNQLVGSSLASVARPVANVVLAVVGGATSNIVQIGAMGGPTATAVGAGDYTCRHQVRGLHTIPPGTAWGITGTGAGTSHVVNATMYWEELPVMA